MHVQHIGWPIGDDRIYELEVLLPDGKAPSDPTKGVQDVTGFTLVWVLSATDDHAAAPLLEKRTGGLGIDVTGVYAPVRAANTQRVAITIADTDTDGFVEGIYYHALKRLDPGLESTGVRGKAKLTQTAAPLV